MAVAFRGDAEEDQWPEAVCPHRKDNDYADDPLALAGRLTRALVGGFMVMGTLAVVFLSGAPAQAASPALTGWTQANGSANGCTTVCPASPTARAANFVTYDGATDQVVLFGGLEADSRLNDTWTWDGTTWTQVADAATPAARRPAPTARRRAALSMAYDPASGQLVLFGGDAEVEPERHLDVERHLVDPGGRQRRPRLHDRLHREPPARSGAALAYDPAIGKLVLFGGLGLFNDTWTWDGTSWAQLADSGDPGCTNACTDSPPPSVAPSMAYDEPSSQLILFGGEDYNSNATWNFDGTSWTQLNSGPDMGCTDTCSGSPIARSGAGMEYDPAWANWSCSAASTATPSPTSTTPGRGTAPRGRRWTMTRTLAARPLVPEARPGGRPSP